MDTQEVEWHNERLDLRNRMRCIEAQIRPLVGEAVRAFAAELQHRRMYGEDAAGNEQQLGTLYAKTALRFASAAGNTDLLAEVRQQLELFIATEDVERWIKEGRNG